MKKRLGLRAWRSTAALACVLLTSASLWACSGNGPGADADVLAGQESSLAGATAGSTSLAAASAQPGPDFVVNTAADDDSSVDAYLCSDAHCTLREAMLAANGVTGAATIHFDIGAGQAITLASELPALTSSSGVTIDGQAIGVTIDGAGAYRLFHVSGGAQATLANLTLQNGKYTGGDCGLMPCGGGLKVEASAVVALTRSAILNSTATGSGGGVFNAGQLTVTESSLAGNSADEGGGVLNTGTVVVTQSTLSGNTALYGGGILMVTGGSLTLTNSTLAGNSATSTTAKGGGGALDVYSGTAVITSSTVSGNTAVSPNQAKGGIWLEDGTLTLRNSVVAGNDGTNNFYRSGGTFTSLGYNLSNAWNGMTLGASDLTGDPVLQPLADAGGPTRVMRVLPGSPAVDAIPGCDGAPAADQCGTARPQGAACDIGAYEFVKEQSTTTLESSLNPSLLGQSVTFTATVSPAPASGTITFEESGGGTLGEVSVVSGQATLTTSALGAGEHRVTAVFSGSLTSASSTSGALVQRVRLAPAITSGDSATFTAGAAGALAITTTGYPLPAVSIAGALPAGVTFVDDGDGTATLGGTPAAGAGGVYALTLTAGNGVGANAVQAFTLTVNEAPGITSAAEVTFTVGTAGSFSVKATGCPAPAIRQAGGLPAGITFTDNGDGTATLGGTPAAGTAGAYELALTATNGTSPDATQELTLTISDPASEPGQSSPGGRGGCTSAAADGFGTALLPLLFWLRRREREAARRRARAAARMAGSRR